MARACCAVFRRHISVAHFCRFASNRQPIAQCLMRTVYGIALHQLLLLASCDDYPSGSIGLLRMVCHAGQCNGSWCTRDAAGYCVLRMEYCVEPAAAIALGHLAPVGAFLARRHIGHIGGMALNGQPISPGSAHKKRRLTRENWLEMGLAMLADPATVINVEEVCRKAGKTIGGFYFHFEGIDDYLHALAELWRKRFTDDLVRATHSALPSPKRLDLLNYLAVHLDANVEQGIRRLSAREPAVAGIVREVDAERTGYLADLYEASGSFTSAQASALARIEYAAFVGMQQTEIDSSPEELLALYKQFLALTGRADNSGDNG